MKEMTIELATILDTAAHEAKSVSQLSLEHNFDLDEAYNIQAASIQRRFEREETLVGLKMGFTSKAKMEQMGVHDLIWGRLTSTMHVENNGQLEKRKFIHPRAEPEVAFLIKKDLDKELSLEEVSDYIEAVAPAIEIIDSRYQNFKFSLEDVVADNCSSAAFVVGEWKAMDKDISDLAIDLKVNGEVVHNGSTHAILGNPLLSLVDAVRLSFKYGEKIEKGMIILAGSATPAVYIDIDQEIKAEVEGLGSVALSIV